MSTEFVGIQLDLMGAEGVRRDLEQLDQLLNSLRGRKKFDIGFSEARAQVVAYKGELEKLKREQSKYAKGSDDWNRVAGEIDQVRQKLWNAQQAVREFGYASREAGRTFKETFNSISSKVAHVGSAMQSFGNALTQLTSPFSRITNGILLGAGFKAFNSFSEGFERGFTRYDIMKKYPKIMAAFGYSAEQSQKSIDALDKSVRGLPTGLDEMVDLAQRFTATTGDIEKGTKLAIAANNAFLASMSTDTQKYQGMMQLQDVLGGKDMNAREWNSLVSSMTPAIVKMGEAQGYTNENMSEWIQQVRDGKVANDEFIDTLIKIGNEGGVLEKMAYESKDTWQAFFANVGNAASRMTAGIIQSMDEVVKALNITDADGNAIDSVNLLLSNKVIPAIDRTTESVKKWIKAHPEEITNFFKNLSQIKIGNFLRGYAKGLELMVGLVERLSTALGEHPNLMTFLGGFFGVGGLLGKMSTIGGGLLKGTRHIWGGIGAGGAWLFKGKLGKLGIFGRLAQIFGKKKDIQDAGDVAKEIPSISNTFKSAFASLEGLIKAAGAVTIVAGTGAAVFASAKSILKNLKEMVDIVNGGGWDNVGYVAGGVIVAIGAFTEIFNAIGEALGPTGLLNTAIASAASLFVTGTVWADTELILDGLKNIKETILEIDEVASAIENLKGFASIGDDAKDRLRNAVDAIQEVNSILGGQSGGPADRGVYRKGLPMFTGNRAKAVADIATALKSMKDIVNRLNELSALTVNDPSAVIEEIKKACDKLQGIHGPRTLLKDTTKVADALIQIRRMAYHINKLAGTDVDTGGFASFVEQIKTALEGLKDLNGELMLDIEVKLSPMFGSSVAAVKKNINKAKSDIKKLNKPISFTIPVHVRFSLSTNLGTILGLIRGARARIRAAGGGGGTPSAGDKHGGVQQATGGYIYRAFGGGIGFPGKPRGTDVVPTWLTPGEYVHNKRAVNTFGLEFMRKVNNLDMRGAMNELMHRAGSMANINRGTTITNNNYNNQRVVINNNSAGAGYTFRTASRFVGAF